MTMNASPSSSRRRGRLMPVIGVAVSGVLLAGCGGSTTPTSDTTPDTTTATTTAVRTATTSTVSTTTTTAATTTSVQVAGPAGSKPATSPDMRMVMNIDPTWPSVAASDAPPGGAIWFTNLTKGGSPTDTTDSVTLVSEALRGATLEEDVTNSLKELHLVPKSRTNLTLPDGAPAIRVDATTAGDRLVAIIALDASGTNTISATFLSNDNAGFAQRLKPIEPYLRTLRKG